MKAYVILRKGYEYNDEIYSESDSGGGFPKKIFFTKPDAQKEVQKMNIEQFKQENLEGYAYDMEDIVHDVEKLTTLVNTLNTKYGVRKGHYSGELGLNESATNEESIEYMNLVNLSFFEIVETEVDENDFIKTFRESKLNDVL